MRNQRGFALVITLVITALLVALVVQFIDDVYVETSSRQNFVDGQQAGLMANSGVDAGRKLLQLTLSSRPYTTLSDQWAKPIQLADEKGTLQVVIEDESAKLNLNLVFGENGVKDDFLHGVASRLLKKQGLSLDLLDALKDWVDNNDDPSPGGGESPYYMNLKPPYQAHNKKLRTVEELALVRGFDRATIERLRPLITVFPSEKQGEAAKININTAPQKIIAALSEGMTDETAKTVVDYRVTTPFKTGIGITTVPGVEASLPTADLTVKGEIYRIISRATVRNVTRTVEAVFDMTTQHFLYWREY